MSAESQPHPLETRIGALSAISMFFILGALVGYLFWTMLDKNHLARVLQDFDETLINTYCHQDDFAKRSAEPYGRRHEGSLPVRADTLVSVSEASRARPAGHAQALRF